MKFEPPFPDSLPDTDTLGIIGAANTYAIRLRTFYNSRAVWHRRFYRFSGILVIAAGAGLPVVANLDYGAKELVVSLMGTLVALLTALHAFYRWDQSWMLLRHTEMRLTSAYWAWRAALPAADGAPDPATVALTRDFLLALSQIRDQEAVSFFEKLSFPTATANHVDVR
ncbi:DUF4231 domain-containing protein [Saccharomonospora sp. NPDC006951]